MEHAFGHDFTVGVEEELLLVDPETRALAPVAARVLAAIQDRGDTVAHEAYAAELELRSPVCSHAGEAAAALGDGRAAARAAGATLLGAGLHPTAALGDAPLVDAERYRRVGDSMRGLIRRTPECALHVHVGMPDAEAAIRAYNGLRSRLPLLQGLAANSPWWFGADSGLASARWALVRAYPGRGVPRAFRDFGDYEATLAASTAAAEVEDYTMLWWDLRPHPRLGTVELRELDAQSSLEDVAAIAALAQALAAEAADGATGPDEPQEAVAWSSFRAARDGTAARIADGGSLAPLAEVARRAVERARPAARDLGPDHALDGVERILRDGGGAGRQREAHAAGGMAALLELLIRQTELPLARREP